MYPSLEVSIGSFLGNKAFIAAVVGGIGSIKGAMWGGIMMGIIEVFATNINADLGFGVAYLVDVYKRQITHWLSDWLPRKRLIPLKNIPEK